MSAYVDSSFNKIRAYITSRLWADTRQELEEMARWLSIKPSTKMDPDTPYEHYNIGKGQRAVAISRGCVSLTKDDFYTSVVERAKDPDFMFRYHPRPAEVLYRSLAADLIASQLRTSGEPTTTPSGGTELSLREEGSLS